MTDAHSSSISFFKKVFQINGFLILLVILTFCNASNPNDKPNVTLSNHPTNKIIITESESENTPKSESAKNSHNDDSNSEDSDKTENSNTESEDSANSENSKDDIDSQNENTNSNQTDEISNNETTLKDSESSDDENENENKTKSENSQQNTKNEDYLIEGPIFRVSYNEIKEQPNWLEYTVRPNLQARTSRDGRNFYEVDSVHTSDDDDYYKNIWDKGHLAPAAAFVDNDSFMHESFSYLNCSLQHQSLNRGQWAVLESELRKRANQYQKPVCVRIELIFDEQSIILPTDAVVPSGYIKYSYIQGVGQECYQFKNEKPSGSWREQIIDCPKDIDCYNPK